MNLSHYYSIRIPFQLNGSWNHWKLRNPGYDTVLKQTTNEYIKCAVQDVRAAVEQSAQRLSTGWTIEGSELESRWFQNFSFLYIAQTDCGFHAAFYEMGNRDSFAEGKAAGE
jgi:hypothetical protein